MMNIEAMRKVARMRLPDSAWSGVTAALERVPCDRREVAIDLLYERLAAHRVGSLRKGARIKIGQREIDGVVLRAYIAHVEEDRIFDLSVRDKKGKLRLVTNDQIQSVIAS